jgi:hypothetical protein
MIVRRLIAAAALALLFGVAHARAQPPAPRDEPATKFEKFSLAKGVIRVREFYEVGTIPGRYGSAKFDVARSYTPGQRDFIYALRVEVKESGRLERERIGVLDAEEVASLAAALPQMAKMSDSLRGTKPAATTEAEFKGGSLKLGFFVSARGGGSPDGVFITAGEIGSTTAFFNTEDFPKIEKYVKDALARIRELQQAR